MNMELASSSNSPSKLSIAALLIAVVGVAVGGMGLANAKKANESLDAMQLKVRQAASAGEQAQADMGSIQQQMNSALRILDQRCAVLAQQVEELKAKPTAPPPPPARPGNTAVDSGETGNTPDVAGAKVHVVAKGDLLGVIAKKYGKTVSQIEKANPGLKPTNMKIGQKIKIP